VPFPQSIYVQFVEPDGPQAILQESQGALAEAALPPPTEVNDNERKMIVITKDARSTYFMVL
jgi:hypothetical protein